MDKGYITTCELKIRKILTSEQSSKDIPICILSDSLCSELSRLLGGWFKHDFSESTVFILKGLLPHGGFHDVVCVQFKKSFFLVDPSIWQFFPDADSILLGTFKNKFSAINILKIKYGGTWFVSDHIINNLFEEKLKSIIKLTLRENIDSYVWGYDCK